MKALVLGAGGMAGHVVAVHLRECGHEVETLSARQPLDDNTILVDVLDQDAFDATLDATSPDVVVNCIGLLVQESEERPDRASYLNGHLPHRLEHRYARSATKLIHISTDCVFAGTSAPYTEDSPYDGQSFYDRSKALGEVRNDKDLTFRMSIVGPDMKAQGTGLFNWFQRQTSDIAGFTNAIWSGITTIELARGIVAAIEQDLTGLYHLVPNSGISKFELLKLFQATFERDDIRVLPDDRAAHDKTLICTRSDFDHVVPDYASMVAGMRDWIDAHTDLYPHYVRSGVTT